jgi:hypothetical protein
METALRALADDSRRAVLEALLTAAQPRGTGSAATYCTPGGLAAPAGPGRSGPVLSNHALCPPPRTGTATRGRRTQTRHSAEVDISAVMRDRLGRARCAAAQQASALALRCGSRVGDLGEVDVGVRSTKAGLGPRLSEDPVQFSTCASLGNSNHSPPTSISKLGLCC